MSRPIWTPSPERVKSSQMTRYQKTVGFSSYDELYRWSVSRIAPFWESVWKFSKIRASAPPIRVMGEAKMPGTRWFEGARLNFAENLLRRCDTHTAVIAYGEDRPPLRLSYQGLYEKTAQLAASLRKAGIQSGDRIAGYLPNIPETVIAMLAATSLGAVWSSCSPDFGVEGIVDRFGQIEPKILFAVDGYFYNGKRFDCLGRLKEILQRLPSIAQTVVVPYTEEKPALPGACHTTLWDDFLSASGDLSFQQLPFDHPVYILYSSGTTGVPKCIVHGAGGTLLQHSKELLLHSDLKPDDRIFYFTTCSWMMWNWLVSSLVAGATIVLYEGNPAYPDLNVLWKMAEKEKITHFGTSPKFLTACAKGGITPGKEHDLSALRTLLSTGSPLSVENFEWVYARVKKDLHLASISGGTDIIGCFMLGNPNLPVYSGEIQCRGLGMKVECWDENRNPVVGKKGELVCTAPFPSMPVRFWNDPDGTKYRAAYFEHFPGIWRHGDFIEITARGGVIVYGRSDATLNPGGVRIGTAEIYRQVETVPQVVDSLVIGQNWKNDIRVVLFVVLKPGVALNDRLIATIKETIKKGTTPRHVPAKILQVKEIPYTVSGKKVELAVANVVHGEPVKNREALANPDSLDQFRKLPALRIA